MRPVNARARTRRTASRPIAKVRAQRQPAAPLEGAARKRRAVVAPAARVQRLEQKLAATSAYLQSVIERQRAANADLQSINEELETSKEAIQSSNKELSAVNEDLRSRNSELNRANSALKQDCEMLARKAMLLEQAHEAIYDCDLEGAIDYWNRGAERLYGYTRDEARGRSSQGLLGATDEHVDSVRRALQGSGQWTGELIHRTKAGREIVVDSHQTLIMEGGRARVLVANRDVTERKQGEETLRRRVEELAAGDRRRNEFVAMLAHELRNPLAPLRNAVEILRNPAKSAEDTARTQDLIDRQITKMTRLVDDLLDAARVTRGQIQLRTERADLRQMVQRAAETTLDVIKARNQQLVIDGTDDPLIVDADPVRIEQVFANLLTNASKYSQDRGTITVAMSLGRDATGGRPLAVVKVSDDGIGIEKDMLPRVFDLFAQADRSLARTQGGLGIGLSLVKSLVDLHGGRVTAHSEGRDRGSEFTVYLPTRDTGGAKARA